MNIMEMTSGDGFSGAVMSCLILTRELSRRGHKVILVCRPGSWISRQPMGDSVKVLLSDLNPYSTDELRRIAVLAGTTHVDVIHTHSSRAHFFGVLLRLFWGLRCVATAHNCHFQLHWMFNDHVIAVSGYTGRFHRRFNLVRERQIHVVHNFIDHRIFLGDPDDSRLRTRRAFGLNASSLLVGAVGQISAQKGTLFLVRAMKEVVTRVPRAMLLMVGNPTAGFISKLKTEAQKLGVAGHIIWVGPRFDIPNLLLGLDVFVSASLSENFPISILEAMAAGLPVIGTKVGGVPESIQDGENGILVPPGNSRALAEAIFLLLDDADLRKKLVEAGRRRVLEEFSPEAKVPMIEHILGLAAGTKVNET